MEYNNPQKTDISNPEAFDARAFLQEFRQTMVEAGQVFQGPVKGVHKEVLREYVLDAQIVAEGQVERTKKLLPDDTPDTFLDKAGLYTEAFTRLARGLGISVLRLADKGDARFASALRDPSSRQRVFRSLATDFRSIAWHLEGESIEGFNTNTLRSYVALYQSASIVRELQEQFSQFSPTDFKLAILGRPKNPKGFIEFVATKIEDLTASSKYEDMPPSVIKHAVMAHTSAPEAYLDKMIATTEELAADPRYADFGMRAIRYVVTHYTKTSPRTALDRAIVKAEQLQQDVRFANLPPSLVKSTVITSPESVEDILVTAVSTIASLMANPRYNVFGAGNIAQAALFHPRDTASFLETARQRYDVFRSDPRYVTINDGYIRDVVLNRTKSPRAFLDSALTKISQLQNEPRYEEFGVGYITDAVFRRPDRPEVYLDKILAKIEAYEADPTFAGLKRKTIRYVIINQPNEADNILRRLADKKISRE